MSDRVATEWEDPPRAALSEAASVGVAPFLSVEGFEGPLDWLLDMAQARRIDLARLSILALINAFAVAMQDAISGRSGAVAELGRWGDWLVMAASLALIRSRLLLPIDARDARDAEDEAEALRRRLLDRAELRAAADWLDRRPRLGRDVFPRGDPDRDPRHANGAGAKTIDITELLRACLVALKLPEDIEAYRPRPPPLWRVTDAIERIASLIQTFPDGQPLAAYLPADIHADVAGKIFRRRAALSSTLVAALELAKGGALLLCQDDDFCLVTVHRNFSEEHDAPGLAK